MHSTYTGWVEFLNTLDGDWGRGRVQILSKSESVSLHDLFSTDRHLLRVPFVRNLKSNLCTALNTLQKTTIISHAQNTTALQVQCIFNWNISVTGHQ